MLHPTHQHPKMSTKKPERSNGVSRLTWEQFSSVATVRPPGAYEVRDADHKQTNAKLLRPKLNVPSLCEENLKSLKKEPGEMRLVHRTLNGTALRSCLFYPVLISDPDISSRYWHLFGRRWLMVCFPHQPYQVYHCFWCGRCTSRMRWDLSYRVLHMRPAVDLIHQPLSPWLGW